MEANSAAKKSRRTLRFWLGVLLVLVLCLVSWLAGRSVGNREGAARARSVNPPHMPTSPKSYYVGDFVLDSATERHRGVIYDDLITNIQENCSPDRWEEAGGPGRISPFPLNTTLIVSGDDKMHSEIEEVLTKLRKEKYGADFNPQYRGILETPPPKQ